MMTIKSHLTKLLRLAEITSGYAKTDESGIYRFDPNPKLEVLTEALKEYLEDNPTSKVQIWSCFVENIKQIFYRLNEVEKIPSVKFYGGTSDNERIEAERRFNTDPSTKVFIGNPAAGGVGLNLLGFDPYNPNKFDTNCDWVIYYSNNWSTVTRRQSEDRAYRYGTRVPVRITNLVVPDSIDEYILDTVNGKIKAAMSVQDVRGLLSRIVSVSPLSNGD
jgi:SNF2 family DNA or RNA helicase